MSFESEVRSCRLVLGQVVRILSVTERRALIASARGDSGELVPARTGLEIGAELLAVALEHADRAAVLLQTDAQRTIYRELKSELLLARREMEGRGIVVKPRSSR